MPSLACMYGLVETSLLFRQAGTVLQDIMVLLRLALTEKCNNFLDFDSFDYYLI